MQSTELVMLELIMTFKKPYLFIDCGKLSVVKEYDYSGLIDDIRT